MKADISRVNLADAFWFQEGPGVRTSQFTSIGIKLLNVSNITKGGQLNLANSRRFLSPKEVANKYTHFMVDAGDLVIASSGISFDTDELLRTRGAFVSKEHLPLVLNTSTIRFKAVPHKSDLRFLRHWLQSYEFRTQISRMVTGSAQQNFGPSHLKSIGISLPPLPEQQRIAAILDQAEALQAKRRQALAKLDTLTQSLFLEMFGDLRSNPYGWPIGTVNDLVNDTKGDIRCGPFGTQLKVAEILPDGVPIFGIETAVANRFNPDIRKFVSTKKAEELKAFTAFPGDVLVTRMGTIGRSCVVPSSVQEARFSYHLFRIRPDQKKCLPEFLAGTISHSGIFARQLQDMAHGAIMEGLSTDNLRRVRFIIPPIHVQREYLECLQSIEDLGSKMSSASLWGDLFTTLQHRAFRGEL